MQVNKKNMNLISSQNLKIIFLIAEPASLILADDNDRFYIKL